MGCVIKRFILMEYNRIMSEAVCLLWMYYFREMTSTDTENVGHYMTARLIMKMSLHLRRVMWSSSWLRRQRMTTGWRVSWSLTLTDEVSSHPHLSTCSQTDHHPCHVMQNRHVCTCVHMSHPVCTHVREVVKVARSWHQGTAAFQPRALIPCITRAYNHTPPPTSETDKYTRRKSNNIYLSQWIFLIIIIQTLPI